MRNSLIALCLLVGCGGDDDGGGGPITLSNLGSAMGTAYCAKAFECCTAAEISDRFAGAPFSDEPGCVQFYTQIYMTFTQMYQASIDAGRLVYNASAAGMCLNALQVQTCQDFANEHDPLSEACPNPFQGQVAADASCNFDEECASGYCQGDSQGPSPTAGVCKPLPTSGQACIDFTCASGLQCQAGTCMALKADGASCYDGDECASGGCNGAGQSTPGTCGVSLTCNGQ